jgi:hypothetical protein
MAMNKREALTLVTLDDGTTVARTTDDKVNLLINKVCALSDRIDDLSAQLTALRQMRSSRYGPCA